MMRLTQAFAIGLLTQSAFASPGPAPAYDGQYHDLWYPIGFTNTSFAKTDGRLFNVNGETQYLAGANAWWVPRLNNTADVDKVLDEFVASGLKVLRAWAYATHNFTEYIPYPGAGIYGSWFQLINQTGTYINYGPRGLRQLDYVVHAAEQRGIFLVLPLVDCNPATLNAQGQPDLSLDLGGIDLYQNVFGCNSTQWWTDSRCQNAYRSYAQTIITRYRSSPAVFAWEIMNEPRCHLANGDGCDTSIIYKWASQTSAWVKSLDPNHMVTLGEEGWFTPQDGFSNADDLAYSGEFGIDFVRNIQIPTIDYDTVHVYPKGYTYNNSWGNTWIKQHDLIGASVNKPVVVEEYGVQPFSAMLPWQKTILQNTMIAMDMIWDFNTHVSQIGYCKTCPVYQDSYSLFYGTANYQKYVINHAKAMNSKKVSK